VRAKLLWILLAASLLLNAFFAGGYVYSKTTAERLRDGPGARFEMVVEELDLSQSEHEQLRALRQAVGARRAQMREQGQPLRQALIAEMREPTLDQRRVDELLRERSKLFVNFLGGVMSEMHAFLDGLEPEKKQAFLAMMEQEHRFLWRLLGHRGRDSRKSPP
jgi:uncharacterized membrane protein